MFLIIFYLLAMKNGSSKARLKTRIRRNNMSTDTTALAVAASLPTEELEALLQQKQSQKGLDRVKEILESSDPAHKTIQDILVKKVKVWDRSHAPKKPYTGKPRGRKKGSKNTPAVSEQPAETVA